MKKTIFNIVLALTLVTAGISGLKLNANAETIPRGWTVTYTGMDEDKNPVFTSTYSSDYREIDNAMPGDTIEYTITYVNATDEEADFYMNANVLDSLEDGNSGGAYSYRITNNDKDLFNSNTVGGDGAAVVGLKQVSGNSGLYFSLGTVGKKSATTHSGKVKVLIQLDGDSQLNSYGNKDASLEFFFKAEPTSSAVEKRTTTIVKQQEMSKEVSVSQQKSIVKQIVKTLDNGTEIVEIDDDNVPLAGPATGDSILPSAICSVMFALGMCLIFYSVAISINKKRREA
ncbi:hypothetical protein [Pseudobutyrivibrio xylanivorans]|uniref:Uncharacterized protein n=1 Tax=Pseudobutyrivibrio xylanivorans TaxID=185007 RepID=A0A1G5S3V1_PSEXY|nr:hypothetical protein [Pseudobutyrivibrio xylanivorans]SCZ80996.1 hypothetical protein SAMN02910350_02584 [Pseudobutyrivibrio xylanivorans]